MQFDCGTCHKPHAKTKAEELVGCRTCHTQMQRAGLHALGGHAECRTCHTAHLWRTAEGGCLKCHGNSRNHARGRPCAACHSFAGAGRPAMAPHPF